MAETDLSPEIIDRSFVDRLNRALRIRGSIGDFVALNPQLQPTVDVTRFLSGIVEALDPQQIAGINLTDLAVLGPANETLTIANGLAAGAFLARHSEDNDSQVNVVNRMFHLSGSNCSFAEGAGLAFFNGQPRNAFPGGVYRLEAEVMSGAADEFAFAVKAVTGWGGESTGLIGNLEGVRDVFLAQSDYSGNQATGTTSYASVRSLVQFSADAGIRGLLIELRNAQAHNEMVGGRARISFHRVLSAPLVLPVL